MTGSSCSQTLVLSSSLSCNHIDSTLPLSSLGCYALLCTTEPLNHWTLEPTATTLMPSAPRPCKVLTRTPQSDIFNFSLPTGSIATKLIIWWLALLLNMFQPYFCWKLASLLGCKVRKITICHTAHACWYIAMLELNHVAAYFPKAEWRLVPKNACSSLVLRYCRNVHPMWVRFS